MLYCGMKISNLSLTFNDVLLRPGYSDFERAETALKGIQGKRLTYRRIDSAFA